MNCAGRKLLRLYGKSRHWEKRGTEYAERFNRFLMFNNWGNVKGMLLLDVGCGNGRDLRYFESKGYVAWGIDCSKAAVDSVGIDRTKLEKIEHTTIHSNDYDAVYAVSVMHYTDEKIALKQIHRILKPLGYAFLHFNLEIKQSGEEVLDYKRKQKDIFRNIFDAGFEFARGSVFERLDRKPFPHRHKVLEVILQKP